MDTTRRWQLTKPITNDEPAQQAALRFPTGGVYAASGNRTLHLDTDRHEGIEREILATLDNLRSGLNEITALLDDSIPFPGGFFDDNHNRPSAA